MRELKDFKLQEEETPNPERKLLLLKVQKKVRVLKKNHQILTSLLTVNRI